MHTPLDFQALILAAGMGTRMRSDTVKVLHEVLGKPMITHVVDSALQAGASRVIAVLGHQRERVEDCLKGHPGHARLHVAIQHEQLGTAHAVFAAKDFFAPGAPEWTLILSGDVPNMDAQTLGHFIEGALASEATLAVMTAVLDEPGAYGRIVRDSQGQVLAIVEHRDASDAQRAICEINAGIYLARTAFLARGLPQICSQPATNAQAEYYLTDLVQMAAATESGVLGWVVPEVGLIQGVNTRVDLAQAQEFARRRLNQHWMLAGVTMIDPLRTLVEPGVVMEPDVVLYPDVHLCGQTRLARGARIEAGSVLVNTSVGADAVIKAYSYLEDSAVGPSSQVGPFAHLRPGSDIGAGCKIGNFVEVKKTRMDDGAKASHLTYLGDAHVGAGANVGAGTITCNYDGAHKHRTEIGPGAFIGSNTALVAPVQVGQGAYVGAGSVITEDVPSRALAIARARQRNIEGWADQTKDQP